MELGFDPIADVQETQSPADISDKTFELSPRLHVRANACNFYPEIYLDTVEDDGTKIFALPYSVYWQFHRKLITQCKLDHRTIINLTENFFLIKQPHPYTVFSFAICKFGIDQKLIARTELSKTELKMFLRAHEEIQEAAGSGLLRWRN